jgi:hypothetical protein
MQSFSDLCNAVQPMPTFHTRRIPLIVDRRRGPVAKSMQQHWSVSWQIRPLGGASRCPRSITQLACLTEAQNKPAHEMHGRVDHGSVTGRERIYCGRFQLSNKRTGTELRTETMVQ